VSEYVRARAKPGQTEEKRPLTPIEERDRIVEEMGRLEQQHYEKFAAIRQLNSEAPASVKNVDDLKKRIDSLWERICQRGGSVEYHNRAVAISRQDLSIYEELGNLHFRKRAIEKKLQAGQTQPSNSA
ncbi:MAG: hypothetical protein JRN67_11855, partial [Nitrososphaerota archaeon]|nr:hypothetical protein [Nitrososphaerota archaeon]